MQQHFYAGNSANELRHPVSQLQDAAGSVEHDVTWRR